MSSTPSDKMKGVLSKKNEEILPSPYSSLVISSDTLNEGHISAQVLQMRLENQILQEVEGQKKQETKESYLSMEFDDFDCCKVMESIDL